MLYVLKTVLQLRLGLLLSEGWTTECSLQLNNVWMQLTNRNQQSWSIANDVLACHCHHWPLIGDFLWLCNKLILTMNGWCNAWLIVHCCIFKTTPHLSFEGPLGAVLLLQHMLNKKHWSSSLSRSVSLVSHWHIKNLRIRGFNLVSCDVWAADGLGSGHPTKHEPYWYHHPSTAVLTLPTKEVPDRNVQIQRSPTKIAHSSYMHTG